MSRSNLRSSREVPRLGGYLHPLAFFNKKRHADFEARFERGRLGYPARGVAAHPRLSVLYRELHVSRQLHSDGIAVVLLELNDQAFHKKILRLTDHLGGQRQRFKALLVHEVEAIAV